MVIGFSLDEPGSSWLLSRFSLVESKYSMGKETEFCDSSSSGDRMVTSLGEPREVKGEEERVSDWRLEGGVGERCTWGRGWS